MKDSAAMKPIFQRSPHNPILAARDMPFPAAAVLNPGATEHEGDVVLVLRVEDHAGFSSIYVARSKDGVTGWRIQPEPLLRHGEPRWRYEMYGCEDPRVVYLSEQGYWYITYTGYSSSGAAVALARTKDFVEAERVGLIFSPNNKDSALFPKRFNGRWAVLHRPDAGGGIEDIWIAYSPDLIHWGEPRCVLREGYGPAWDAVKVGAGPPPVLTEFGWLLIYHGVKAYGGELLYRAGAAVLDEIEPHEVIGRTSGWLFQAEEIYEVSGLVPGVVFPTGMLIRGDELWMYYGAADTCVCLATAKLKDVLEVVVPQ
ncbi:MAG: glycosidase [Phycisphaerae bacterium]|nr:glycosidase [Phycisphaerae bacterium]